MHSFMVQSISIIHKGETFISFDHSLINPKLFGTDIWIIGIVWKREKVYLHTVQECFLLYVVFMSKLFLTVYSCLLCNICVRKIMLIGPRGVWVRRNMRRQREADGTPLPRGEGKF